MDVWCLFISLMIISVTVLFISENDLHVRVGGAVRVARCQIKCTHHVYAHMCLRLLHQKPFDDFIRLDVDNLSQDAKMCQPHRLHQLDELQAAFIVEDRTRLIIEFILCGSCFDTALGACPLASSHRFLSNLVSNGLLLRHLYIITIGSFARTSSQLYTFFRQHRILTEEAVRDREFVLWVPLLVDLLE